LKQRITCVDIRTKLEFEGEAVLAQDWQHPNDLGHRIISQTITGTLSNCE